ncbi:MAG: hypothetical protein GEU93_04270 [Propionibacteriales bacterium]|nr:hypothetical protein [Propionibacteriales bacterium]
MRWVATFREADAVSGGILAVFGVFVLFQSLQLRFYIEGVPGPGFFPALLGIALMVTGVALVVTRLRTPRGTAEEFRLPGRHEAMRSLGLWVAVMAAALLVGSLGFLLTMFLLVAVILFVIERRRGLSSVITAIAVPLLVWLLFAELLQVRLPAGPFGS